MREITIDFTNCTYSQIAGYVGERNATEVKCIKPEELSGSQFLIAFNANGKVFRSRFFGADEEIKVELWGELTQDNALLVQLESYDESKDYLGKSAVAKLVFQKSLDGLDAIADTDNPDLITEISANTTMRKKLADNADVLVKFYVSDSGELLFDGKEIVSEAGGFSPIVSVTEIDGGHRVTITDVEGEKSFDVLDGGKGEKGDPYTLTEVDKAEIANAVLNSLAVAEGGLY